MASVKYTGYSVGLTISKTRVTMGILWLAVKKELMSRKILILVAGRSMILTTGPSAKTLTLNLAIYCRQFCVSSHTYKSIRWIVLSTDARYHNDLSGAFRYSLVRGITASASPSAVMFMPRCLFWK